MAVVKVIMDSFKDEPDTLERLKNAKNRWGAAPAAMAEGDAPAMIAACVMESLQVRREAENDLQRRRENDDDTHDKGRWCESPAVAPKLPKGLARKLALDARERSKRQFEAVQHELLGPKSSPHLQQPCVGYMSLPVSRPSLFHHDCLALCMPLSVFSRSMHAPTGLSECASK